MKNMLAVVTLLFASLSHAQPVETDRAKAMDKLAFLVGEWRGEGWILDRDGTRRTFASREAISKKLNGTALLIEGSHTGFEAMAVVTYDLKAQKYRWRSFTSRGDGADAEARLIGARALQWQPSPTSRYTIKTTESGAWEEVGERTADGGGNLDAVL